MKRLAAASSLIALLTVAIVYFVRAMQPPPPEPGRRFREPDAVVVTAATVRTEILEESIEISGVFRAENQVAINARVPGRILSIQVHEGDFIKSGTLVALLDVGDSTAQVEGAQAGVDGAAALLRKAVDGKRARQIEQDALVDQAEAGLKTALAKRQQAELGVALTKSSSISDSERAQAAVRGAEAALKQAEIGLAQAKQTVKRLLPLYEKGGIARVDLEGAQTQEAIAEAQVRAAVAGLDQAKAAARPAADTAPLREKVSEGDLETARIGVRLAEAGVKSARKARAEVLQIAERDVEAAKAQVRQARSGTRQASTAVGDGKITSPISGYVTELTAKPGEFAQPGYALMNITSPDKLILEAAIAPSQAARIRAGTPVDVQPDGTGGKLLKGVTLSPVAVSSGEGRTVTMRVHVTGPTNGVTPGSLGKGTVRPAAGASRLTLQVDAIRYDGSKAYVYRIGGGLATRRDVVLGSTIGSNVSILSGLVKGERVVLSAPGTLKSGDKITVRGE